MRRALPPLSLLVALSLAACSDDGTQGTSEGGSQGPGSTAPGTTAPGTTTPGTTSGTTTGTTAPGTTTTHGDGDGDGDGDLTTTGEGPKFDVGDGTGTGGDIPPNFPTTCEEAEAGNTSVGCTFYPAALPGSALFPNTTPGFAVSNVGTETATVELYDFAGVVDSAMVEPGGIHVFQNIDHIMTNTTGVGIDGYAIESDVPLQVFQFLPVNAVETADASIVLPAQALGLKHRAVAYNDLQTGNGRRQNIVIVATEDATEVTVTLEAPGSQINGGGPIPSLDKDMGDDTVMIQLDRLETAVLTASNTNAMTMETTVQLTGSLVESDKPVAVYSGNWLSYVPGIPSNEFNCCADIIATAVPPTTIYGTEYAGVKLLPQGMEDDVWRFIGNADGTTITLSGGVDQVIELNAGEFEDVETDQVFWASGDEPFGVVHFMVGSEQVMNMVQPYDCGGMPLNSPGDPAMTWVYPQGNWLNRYLLITGPELEGFEWCNDHMTVVGPMDKWDELTLDGDALPAPTEIGASGHGFVYIQAPGPSHELLAPLNTGVEVTVYGYYDWGSYVYPGGMGLQPLNPQG